MKYVKRQLIFFIVYLIIGALLVAAALLWSPADQREGVVSGIVSGFLVTGAGGIVLSVHLLRNPQKAERTEIMKTEERMQMLRLKTQSAVHTVTVILVCAGTLVSLIFGPREITLTLSALLVAVAVSYVCIGTYYSKKF